MVRALTAALLMFAFVESPPARPEPDCVRLGGTQIGQLPLVVELAGEKIEFLEWKSTDITATELIGFTARAPADFRFTVQAGDATFDATANWLHPAGVVGPQVKPIHTLTICAR